jgi:histone H3/H4
MTFPAGYITAQAANLCGISVPNAVTTSSFGNDKLVLIVKTALAATTVTVTCTGLNLAANPEVPATVGGSTGLIIATSSDKQPAYVTVPAIGAISQPTVTMTQAVGAGGVATISFFTSTKLIPSSANQITLTFPSGVTAQGDNLCAVTSSETVSTSKFSAGVITMKLAPYSTLPLGNVVITCTGLTLAAQPEQAATVGQATGLKIQTSVDTTAAFATIPAIGAVKNAVGNFLGKAVGTADQTATITFTTSTALAVDDSIELLFPADLIAANAADKCVITGAAEAAKSTFADSKITIKVKAALAAGPVTVTCTDLKLAAKLATEAADGLSITTSKDTIPAKVATPAIGAITAASLIIGKAVGTADQTATITFTTSTALANADVIALAFPTGLIAANAANKCVVVGATKAAASAFDADVMKVTVAAALAAGPVTVTCTDLKLAAKLAKEAADGLSITTLLKDTIPAKVATPAIGAITAASLIIGKAVGTADQTATITFTTSTALANADVITLAFPTGLIAANAADKCVVVGATKAAASAFDTDVMKVTVAAALAAGPVTVTCTDLKLAAKLATLAADGLSITTSKDATPAKVATRATGIVDVGLASTSPALSATFGAKTLKITAEVDVWTVASAPVVTCIVSSFTNAALASTTRRSLLQTNVVEIEVKNGAGATVGTKLSTGQTFPESIAAPITRSLYLPKASGNANVFAWVCVSFSVLLFWL